MKRFAVTCESREDIRLCSENGASEVILAAEGGSMTALETVSPGSIGEYVIYSHETGLQVSVLMNRLFAQHELPEGKKLFEALADSGADYIHYADPAVLKWAREKGCAEKLVYRPDTLITSRHDAAVWMDTGIGGVCVSPLLTKEEVELIAASVKGCRLLVHGHTLMAESGRSLLSAYGIQAGYENMRNNRHLFLQEEKREGRMPVFENAYGTLVYTDYVLASFGEIGSFAEHADVFEISSVYIGIDAAVKALQGYLAVLAGSDPGKITDEYRQYLSGIEVSGGYYENRTVR